MDAMNHHDDMTHAQDDTRHRQDWSNTIPVPSSLMANVMWSIASPQDTSLAALRDPAWQVRVAAVQALGQRGEAAPVELLQEMLAGDEHVSVQAAAVAALGRLGARTPLHTLAQALHHSEWQVREQAVLALAHHRGSPQAINTLQSALNDADSNVRETATYALQQFQASTSHMAVPVTHRQNPHTETFFHRLKSSFNGGASTAGETIMQEIPLPDRRSNTNARRERKPRRPLLETSFVLVAMLAIVILGAIMLPLLRHPSSSTPAGQPTPQPTWIQCGSTPTPTPASSTPTATPTPTGSTSAGYTPNSAFYGLTPTATPSGPTPTPTPTPAGTPTPFGGVPTPTPCSSTPTPAPGTPATLIYNYKSTYQQVHSVSWSPDGKRVVIADGAVKSWDATTGGNVITYTKHMSGDVNSVVWSPNGKYILGSGNQVEIWDAVTGQSLGVYTPLPLLSHPSPNNNQPYYSTWSPDSTIIASTINNQGAGFGVLFWNTQGTLNEFPHEVSNLASIDEVKWSPDGKYAAFNWDHEVAIFNLTTNSITHLITGNKFTWSPDSKKLATTDDNTGQILTWDVATGKKLSTIQYQDPARGLAGSADIAWSPDGKRLAVAAVNVTEWDISTKQKLATYASQSQLGPGHWATSLAWSPDGTMLALSIGGEVGIGAAEIWQAV